MEEKEKIKVKCPVCGKILGILVSPTADLSKRKLTCPNCKVQSRFSDFRQIDDNPVQDETQIVAALHDTIGSLIDELTGKEYALREGRQLVGRKSFKTPSKADILIETEDRGFSRAQFYLRIIKGRDGLYHTYISEASHSNSTLVNGVMLGDDDEEGLKHNDRISVSNTCLRFVGTSIDDSTGFVHLS